MMVSLYAGRWDFSTYMALVTSSMTILGGR